nr:MAG TPA: protein of unknown function DUF2115 [Siphoviridae sp. ct6662]
MPLYCPLINKRSKEKLYLCGYCNIYPQSAPFLFTD